MQMQGIRLIHFMRQSDRGNSAINGRRFGAAAIAIFLFALSPSVGAIEPYQNYDKKLKTAERVAPLGDELFGDEVSLYNGSTSFTQVDMSIPGNNGLPVEIRRTFSVSPQGPNESIGALANWDIAVPHIHGEFGPSGWVAGDGTALRCSKASAPPGSGYFTSDEIWSGNRLEVPGEGGKVMMVAPNAKLPAPTAPGTWPWITQGNYRIGCLATTANGYPGEGFLVLAPNGDKYFINWMVERNATSMKKPLPGTGTQATTSRKNYYLLATRVEDRNGNWVNYQYSGDKLTRIESSDGRWINLSYSGALVSTVASSAGTYTYQYQSANYRVGGVSSPYLSSITRPDGSTWTFSLSGWLYQRHSPTLTEAPDFSEPPDQIDCPPPGEPDGTFNLTMKHPSGATGTFVFTYQRHYRTRVPKMCSAWAINQFEGYYQLKIPNFFDVYSLQTKQISGPGLSTLNWAYNYGWVWSLGFCRTNGTCMDAPFCPSNEECPVSNGQKYVSVTRPDGTRNRYTFGVQYGINEGRLFKSDVISGSSVLKATENVYHTPIANDLFPDSIGGQLSSASFDPLADKLAPIRSAVTTQDGVAFSRVVQADCQGAGTYCFDAFARPLTNVKASSLGYTRTEASEYHDNLSKWVLGQTARVKCIAPTTSPPAGCGPAGVVVSETTFDTVARPLTESAFGKLTQTLSYNTDGTVATVKDGNNNVTTLSSWKRGIPQSITYPITAESPTGAIQSAVVNDNGWITSVTNEIGSKTCYGYDAMGRISSITYPSETTAAVCDTSKWLATTLAFEPVAVVEYGIPAGHWRQTVTTGNAKKISYYDALWRPLVTKELDATNSTTETLTKRFQRFAYDENGRVEFASYPGTTDALNTGAWTEYDALGRVTSGSQNSELTSAGNPGGLLTTLTEYLPGFKTRVTNPRGLQVTTEYQVYDQPATDLPAGITTSADTATEIHRDVFGKPTLLVRRNHANTQRVERRYVYDGYQQLCKTIEPETGATVMDYDGAGNLQWSASGLTTLTSPLSCDTIAGRDSGRKVTRYYDARSRLTTLNFPDGNGDQNLVYWPDGLVRQITTFNDGGTTSVVNAYDYNKRRLLTGESVSQPGWYAWGIGYGYDANASMSTQTYPTGLMVNYAPNALGQATAVTSTDGWIYANGVSYYPNGALKQFTYGNGVVHTMTQNARQLPARSTDSGGVLDNEYVYDSNANVQYIYDHRNPADHRYLYYDGLDRLTSAGSQMFGGDHWHYFTYDALDNLKSWKLAGVKDYAEYVYTNNRVTNIKNTAGSTVVGLDYDLQGNLANKNGQIHNFDFGNRLRSVTGKESYRYDGYGRRVLNWRPIDNTITLSQYSQAGQLLYDHNTKTSLTTERIYLGGSLLANRETTMATGVVTAKYQHTDALGSPVAVTNMAGAVMDRTNYEPYGTAINKPNYDGIGYTGHVQDGATGLTYMQQRYYDPQIGRMLSVDPVTAYGSGDMRHFNVYAYAYNNPYKFTDPDGRCPEDSTNRTCIQSSNEAKAGSMELSAQSQATYRSQGGQVQVQSGASDEKVGAIVNNSETGSEKVVVMDSSTSTQGGVDTATTNGVPENMVAVVHGHTGPSLKDSDKPGSMGDAQVLKDNGVPNIARDTNGRGAIHEVVDGRYQVRAAPGTRFTNDEINHFESRVDARQEYLNGN